MDLLSPRKLQDLKLKIFLRGSEAFTSQHLQMINEFMARNNSSYIQEILEK